MRGWRTASADFTAADLETATERYRAAPVCWRLAPDPCAAGPVTERRFPIDGTEWAAFFPSLNAPVAIYTCGEAASPLADGVGVIDLAQSNTPLFQQAGDPLGRLGVGLDAGTDAFLAGAASSFDIGVGDDLALLVRFSSPAVGGAARGIVGKRQSSGGNGYGIDLTATGLLRATVDSGAVQVGTNIAAPAHDDGTFHDAFLSIDRAANTITVGSELGSNSASIAAVLTPTSTQLFRLLGDGAANAIAGMVVTYLAIFDNPFTAADLATFRTPV